MSPRLRAIVVVSAAMLCQWSCTRVMGESSAARQVRLPDESRISTGDLIFREGLSNRSRMVRLLDSETSLTHVGLIDKRDGATLVVHIEPGGFEGVSTVRREKLETFLEPHRADAFEVVHVVHADATLGERAVAEALEFQARGVVFDHDAKLSTEHEMYCTELVWKAYRHAGLDLIDGSFSVRRFFTDGRPLVLLSDLRRSSHMRLVSQTTDP